MSGGQIRELQESSAKVKTGEREVEGGVLGAEERTADSEAADKGFKGTNSVGLFFSYFLLHWAQWGVEGGLIGHY